MPGITNGLRRSIRKCIRLAAASPSWRGYDLAVIKQHGRSINAAAFESSGRKCRSEGQRVQPKCRNFCADGRTYEALVLLKGWIRLRAAVSTHGWVGVKFRYALRQMV